MTIHLLNCHWLSKFNILQDGAAKRLRHGRIFKYHLAKKTVATKSDSERTLIIKQHWAKFKGEYSGTAARNGPLSSSSQHLNYGDCMEDKRENYQNCSLLCCIWQLYAVTHAHI